MSGESAFDAGALDRLARIGGADLMRQMVALYLEHGPARISAIVDGAAAGDADAVQRGAHTMKSSAGNVGAVGLQHTADAVETQAADGRIDPAMIERIAREFEESVAALRRALEERTS